MLDKSFKGLSLVQYLVSKSIPLPYFHTKHFTFGNKFCWSSIFLCTNNSKVLWSKKSYIMSPMVLWGHALVFAQLVFIESPTWPGWQTTRYTDSVHSTWSLLPGILNIHQVWQFASSLSEKTWADLTHQKSMVVKHRYMSQREEIDLACPGMVA